MRILKSFYFDNGHKKVIINGMAFFYELQKGVSCTEKNQLILQ